MTRDTWPLEINPRVVSRYVGSSKTALECRDAVNNILVSGPIGSMTYKVR